MDHAHDGMLRHATVRWFANPPHGRARVRVGSDAFTSVPLSVPCDGPTPGETAPGELLAAAYSAFIATNLAERLEHDGVPAQELVINVECRLSSEATGRCVECLDIEVHGRVRGIEQGGFDAAARAALTFSRKAFAMRSNLKTGLRVSLLPSAHHELS
jgi:organic hydroperoxide reductase OsmC/OhrA